MTSSPNSSTPARSSRGRGGDRPKEIPPSYLAFSSLTAGEAHQLVSMLAAEELGLIPTQGQTTLAHCASREHPHQGSDTESLQVNSNSKKVDGKWEKVSDHVGGLFCHGRCGSLGTLSDYLRMIGPEGAADQFWSKDRVLKTVQSLKKQESFDLGWRDFKQNNGYDSSVGISSSHITHVSINTESKQSLDRLRLKYHQMFFQGKSRSDLPVLIEKVAEKRGWAPGVLREAVYEGLVSLAPSDRHEDDVEIGFSYRGLFSSSPGIPVRVIKTRLLNRNQKQDPLSRQTYSDPGTSSIQLGDFSRNGVSFQNSKRLAIVEGEPDAISWRHYGPNDGILCMGNIHAYSHLPELLDVLHVRDREIFYVLDRDMVVDDKKAAKFLRVGNEILGINVEKTTSILQAIHDAGGRVKVWMCPKIEGKACKDVNDFQKTYGSDADIYSCGIPLSSFLNHNNGMTDAVMKTVTASYNCAVHSNSSRTPANSITSSR